MPALRTKAEVQAYASEHGLESRLTEAVNYAISTGSPDPMALIASLLSKQSKAAEGVVDYEAVRNELLTLMDNPMWDDGSLAPTFIRLAWHSSGTYDAATKTGGYQYHHLAQTQ